MDHMEFLFALLLFATLDLVVMNSIVLHCMFIISLWMDYESCGFGL